MIFNFGDFFSLVGRSGSSKLDLDRQEELDDHPRHESYLFQRSTDPGNVWERLETLSGSPDAFSQKW